MKPYSTAAEIRKQSPFKDVTNISDALLTQKIKEADGLIDSVIGGVYRLPLSENPDIIADASKMIASLIVFREQSSNIEGEGSKSIEEQWKIYMDLIKSIGARKLKLLDSTGNELTLTASALITGYPNASSSDINAPDNTTAKFSMNKKF